MIKVKEVPQFKAVVVHPKTMCDYHRLRSFRSIPATNIIESLHRFIRNYELVLGQVYYYRLSNGRWRIHLHGYLKYKGVVAQYLESEDLFGLHNFTVSTQGYAAELAQKLAIAIGAEYTGNNHSFRGAK